MKITLNTKPYLVPQDNLRVNSISLNFPVGKVEFEDNYSYYIMRVLMENYSIKYQTEGELIRALENATIGNFGVSSFKRGDTRYLRVSFLVPEEGIFEDFDLENALNLIHDIIFNSICNDVKYITDEKFNLEVDSLRQSLEKSNSSIKGLLSDEWIKHIDGDKKYDVTLEDDLEYLNNTTKEMIVEMYKEKVLNNNYVTLITGNIVDKEKFLDTFNKVFKQDKDSIEFETEYEPTFDFNRRGEKVIHGDFNQSAVRCQFAHKNFDYKDKYILMLIGTLIDRSENNFLFNTLRLKYNIVYGCYLSSSASIGSIMMTAFLSKENIDKCKEGFIEVLDMLKDKDIFLEAKSKLIRRDQITLYSKLDSKFEKIDNLCDQLLHIDTFEEELNILKNITFEEVENFVNNLELVNTLVIVGDKNE